MAIPGNLLSATTESIDPNTSGWTPKANCTITKGSGGRNGDGCLSVKATAAGEIQVRTVASYPVTAGTVYYTFADTAGTVAERIGIRWLTAAGVEVSITWSLTTLAASSSWHRVSVSGPAPAGATQAQVVLSSTETAAGALHYWENIYLGLPIRTVGNLLDWNTESAETDASGWQVEANASIARQVPVTTWTVSWYYAGGHTIAATAAAAGDMSVVTVARPSVTAGTDYVAYAYLQPPTSSSTAWIELRFYDATGTMLQATRAPLAAPGTGFYRQIVSDIAPAGAVSCAVAAGVTGATAGQVLRFETTAVTVAPKIVAGSVLPYAAGSFERGIAGWTVPSGVATRVRSTPWGAVSYMGSYSMTVTSSTASTSTLRSPRVQVPNAAGLNWRAQITALAGAGSWSNVTVRVHWYSAAGADLGTSAGHGAALPAAGWYRINADQVAPAGATQAEMEIVATAAAAGSVMNLDGLALWQVLPLTAVEAVTASGYARVTLRELTVDNLMTVYRVQQDGTRTLIRGANGLIDRDPIITDIMVIEDHEAPLTEPVYYRIEQYTPSGTLSTTRISDPVTVGLDDPNLAWLKDPGNPQRNCLVMIETAPQWTAPIEQARHKVRGRQNAVVLSDSRGGLEGDLSLWTRSDEERRALRQLLGPGNTLLWQTHPGMGEEPSMYVNVGQAGLARAGGDADDPWRQWTLPLVEADMPVEVGVSGAKGRTWRDVLTEFPTWDAVRSTYASWEAVFLDRR
ncbi:hypothetical protein ABZ733_08515 [Streptomyces longwoodensis]|uniref:hypothetical protein n=1 Tax=Streptomyces longwoodensis TaxID=68231 RepID=UPI0033CC4A59